MYLTIVSGVAVRYKGWLNSMSDKVWVSWEIRQVIKSLSLYEERDIYNRDASERSIQGCPVISA